MFNNILVICTGNICRSPIGEALLARLLKEVEGVSVSSAGIGAVPNGKAHPNSLNILAANGMDWSAHRGRQIIKPMLSQVDLILAMDHSHLEWIRERYPEYRGRTYLSGHWSGSEEVSDPIRKAQTAFDAVYQQLEIHMRQWAEKISPESVSKAH